MASVMSALLQLILQKTRARVVFASACEAFLPEDSQRERARAYNAELAALVQERARPFSI